MSKFGSRCEVVLRAPPRWPPAPDPTGALLSVSHTSAEFPVAHSNDLQRFRMPRLVPARYVRSSHLQDVS